ncbi:MAG: ABC transporter permease [Victivallales bacterium]|nr:ABC transporter permease [Victivallales bacterium]
MASTEGKAIYELRLLENGNATAIFSGQWRRSPSVDLNISAVVKSITVDVAELGEWDDTFVAQIYKLRQVCATSGIDLDYSALPEGARKLLELAISAPVREDDPKKSSKMGLLENIGRQSEDIAKATHTGLHFTGALTVALLRMMVGKARFSMRDLARELYKAGPGAFFIVSLIGFLEGVILAFIGSIPLKMFKAEVYVASFIGIGLLRLLGAVMSGSVMAGRSGAAYAAELGTMKVNEEIDALETMGISPIEYLVLPRFLGLTIMMPFIALISNTFGILGGMGVSVFYLDIPLVEFWTKLIETTRVCDLIIGVITSFVFGMLIAICGCLRGIRCGRDSEAVGLATTASMVSSIICMVIATFTITVVTVALGF